MPSRPVSKGKYQPDESLELYERDRWEVLQVLEDESHANPHMVVEMRVCLERSSDELAPTASEIRAIVRLMMVRVGMTQYHHQCLPVGFPSAALKLADHQVLVLSHLVDADGTCKSGRIMQAHHDGRQLMIQYSGRIDLFTGGTMSTSLNSFLRYFFSEPTNTGGPCLSDGADTSGSDDRKRWSLRRWLR